MIPYSCMKADGGDTVLWQQKQLRRVVQISLEFKFEVLMFLTYM